MRRRVGTKRSLEIQPYRSSKSSRTEPGPIFVPRSILSHYLDFREGLFKEVGKSVSTSRTNYHSPILRNKDADVFRGVCAEFPVIHERFAGKSRTAAPRRTAAWSEESAVGIALDGVACGLGADTEVRELDATADDGDYEQQDLLRHWLCFQRFSGGGGRWQRIGWGNMVA